MSEGLAPILPGADKEVPERDKATNSKNARNGKAKDVTAVERSSFEPALGDKHATLLLARANPTVRRPPTDGRPVVRTRCFPTRDALLALLIADALRPSAASLVLFWRHAGQTTSTGQAADPHGEYFHRSDTAALVLRQIFELSSNEGLTFELSGLPKASPLERRVSPDTPRSRQGSGNVPLVVATGGGA